LGRRLIVEVLDFEPSKCKVDPPGVLFGNDKERVRCKKVVIAQPVDIGGSGAELGGNVKEDHELAEAE
jgi:hypothetical protein